MEVENISNADIFWTSKLIKKMQKYYLYICLTSFIFTCFYLFYILEHKYACFLKILVIDHWF